METVIVFSNSLDKEIEISLRKLRNHARSMGYENWKTADFSEVDDFFRDNSEKITRIYMDKCGVYQSGRFQSVTYGGFQSSGEITDWSEEGWFCHSAIVDYDEDGPLIVELYDFNPGWRGLNIEDHPFKFGFVDE